MEQDKVYTVFGYIRREESALQSSSDESLFQSIPELIIQIIISYYLSKAYFDIIGEGIKASEDKNIIENVKSMYGEYDNRAYTLPVKSTDKKICKWDIVILSATKHQHFGGCLMTMAITSWKDNQNGHTYGWVGWNGDIYKDCVWGEKYSAPGYGQGDILSVQLDLIKGQISFYQNGECHGVAHKDIHQSDKIEYRLELNFSANGIKVELLAYSESYQ